MKDYKTVKTTKEVFDAIFKDHKDKLKVFSSCSAPEGDMYEDPDFGRMDTSYGFDCADYPIIECRTTWLISKESKYRGGEQTFYWLCVPIKETD
jgi:hypothetical protein